MNRHLGYEVLTGAQAGGAVTIIRIHNSQLHKDFCDIHLSFRGKKNNNLRYAWLKIGDYQEDILVVEHETPEIHIHGGKANLKVTTDTLNKLLQTQSDPAPFNFDKKQNLRSLWEKTLQKTRGEKGIAYLLKLEEYNFEFDSKINYNIEGFEYLKPVKIALIGPANSGKSSLLNRILGYSHALVSHVAGTTRDLLRVSLNLGGHEIEFIDTAGFSEASDNIPKDIASQSEKLSEKVMNEADIILAFAELTRTVKNNCEVIHLSSKADLGKVPRKNSHAISSKDGTGIEVLLKKIIQTIAGKKSGDISPVFCEEARELMY